MSNVVLGKDLAIVIPARNEMFLKKTIEDILEHIGGDTIVIAGLDGYWPNPPIVDHPRVILVHHTESIGQRAITDECVRVAQSKYIMKVDAHCSFDQGFDVKLLAKMQDNYTMVPVMRNLWAFDWKCYDCGLRTYQGPTPEVCSSCGGTNIDRKILWVGKDNPQSTSYCFDSEPHFQYFKEYARRPEYAKMKEEEGLTETMSPQGSCFLMTRDRYWELFKETLNSDSGWGSQGLEVAIKSWNNGGRVVVNHDTWYAHMFRTQGGDFSFPYPGPNANVAKRHAKDKLINKDIVWLLEKFWPVPGWTQEQLEELRKS
jgi:ribosomal protein L37E